MAATQAEAPPVDVPSEGQDHPAAKPEPQAPDGIAPGSEGPETSVAPDSVAPDGTDTPVTSAGTPPEGARPDGSSEGTESPDAPAETPSEAPAKGRKGSRAGKGSKDGRTAKTAGEGKGKADRSATPDEQLPPAEEQEPPTPPIESPEQARRVLECLFFTTTEPLSMKRLKRILWSLDDSAIHAALADLDRDMEGRGLQVREVAGGWLMATRGEYSDWVLALHKNKKRRSLTKAMLETVAIVAYRQPLIKAEVDSIRGVDSGGVLRALVDLELVDARDRREVIGRPLQYRTTKVFLKSFGLKSLSDLPSIGQLRNMYKEQEQGADQTGSVPDGTPLAETPPETPEGADALPGPDAPEPPSEVEPAVASEAPIADVPPDADATKPTDVPPGPEGPDGPATATDTVDAANGAKEAAQAPDGAAPDSPDGAPPEKDPTQE